MKKSHTQLVALVKKEASALKKKATLKELRKLDFYELCSHNTDHCIYGQMTGNCYSPRARKLILCCASKSYIQTKGSLESAELNGNPVIGKSEGDMREHYSPIEVFIAKRGNGSNGNNEMLIDYLKGKRKTLTFKPF